MRKRVLFSCLFSLPAIAFAQFNGYDRFLSFEELDKSVGVTGGDISVSGAHYKDGKASLRWAFNPGDTLYIRRDLKFEPKDPSGQDKFLSAFTTWIYNREAMDASLSFQFLKAGKVCCSFPYRLNFTGWRTGWAMYEKDMQGTPEIGMDEICIIVPDRKGEIFIDHLVTSFKMDVRSQTADLQMPFVNKGNIFNKWSEYESITPDIELEATLSEKQKEEIRLVEKRMQEMICSERKVTEKELQDLRREFDTYHITENSEGGVAGNPLFYEVAANTVFSRITSENVVNKIRTNHFDLKTYFGLMGRIANAWNNVTETSAKEELEKMFLQMHRHLVDQGVCYGSCLGTLGLYGYSFRDYFTSYFLMRTVMEKNGYREEVARNLQWYASCVDIYKTPQQPGVDMDELNTISQGRLASVLMMEDGTDKVRHLKMFSRWITNACLPSSGLSDGFKKDGSAYHHCNNYPAYAVGGLSGVTKMIYFLHGTSFAVAPVAHQVIKDVLLTMRFYCNTRSYPLSMSGRHPNGKGELIPDHYILMALSGSPDRQQNIDPDMAEAYLRLTEAPYSYNKQTEAYRKQLADKGYKSEQAPEGNKAMGYACVSVQRRNNWSAVARGHSRYLWAAEHYRGANLFGRYLAHGSLQIMTAPQGEAVSSISGGWQEEGFDWGRIPGTTAIHLPVDQLEANILNVDVFSGFEEMLYSDEAFAGGLSQERMNGNFGMKLHEHDKYNGSHRARKSYHFFDGTIVCLGSDIENTNNDYPTETTIFQLAVKNDADRNFWKTYERNETYWIDPFGTGYYTPVATKFEKNFPQYSRMQNTGKETSGDWVALTVDHGKAPKGASYEYAILPQTDRSVMKAFAKKPSYKVLQKDRNAHIVRDLKSNTTSYVLFETPDVLPKGLVQEVDTSCLVMLRENKEEAILTVSQPDLALYIGTSDDILDEKGKRVERSIYSRPWKTHPSQSVPVRITLKGKWDIRNENPDKYRIISQAGNTTVLEFVCTDAESMDVELSKK